MVLVFATGNKGKLREATEILGDQFEIVSPAQLGLSGDVEETGTTFRQNSLIKAKFIHDSLGQDCFADDSGLEVEALGGAPGVYSARYAGEDGNSEANMTKLLRELSLKGEGTSRKACFKTVVSLILGGEAFFFEGRLDGHIGFERRGDGGFGYDPIFIPDYIPSKEGLVPNVSELTLSEISQEDKNSISHRGKAMKSMSDFLRSR